MLKKLQPYKLKLKDLLKRVVLPGFEGQNLYKVSKFYWDSITQGDVGSRAAAVSFRFILALFPLIICIFSLIPYIPIHNFQESVMLSIKSFFPPQIYDFFDDALTDLIGRKRGLLLSVGFIITIYLASAGINQILVAFAASRHVSKSHHVIKRSLYSMALLLVFLVLISLVTLVSTLGQTGIDYLLQHKIINGSFDYYLLVFFKFLVLVALYYSIISILFNVGHTDKEKFKFLSVGTTMATLLVMLIQKFFSLYLTDIAHLDKLYGPLGAAMAFMLFFYYLFYVIIIGFELNASIARAKRHQKAGH